MAETYFLALGRAWEDEDEDDDEEEERDEDEHGWCRELKAQQMRAEV